MAERRQGVVTVRWYRSALKLDVTDDHMTEKRGDRHRLIIRQVQIQDLDNYTCEALNNLGKSRQHIVLSGEWCRLNGSLYCCRFHISK
ncbi:unnamed protein product [Nezara viridula]|uniref:Ig-like domain-containing protein n=1 Tax=Nezara viridula TaxID=85310 RepID=A0A9P0MJW2_NEZVI|nr:unnamed protein product [Nezara viridula]